MVYDATVDGYCRCTNIGEIYSPVLGICVCDPATTTLPGGCPSAKCGNGEIDTISTDCY